MVAARHPSVFGHDVSPAAADNADMVFALLGGEVHIGRNSLSPEIPQAMGGSGSSALMNSMPPPDGFGSLGADMGGQLFADGSGMDSDGPAPTFSLQPLPSLANTPVRAPQLTPVAGELWNELQSVYEPTCWWGAGLGEAYDPVTEALAHTPLLAPAASGPVSTPASSAGGGGGGGGGLNIFGLSEGLPEGGVHAHNAGGLLTPLPAHHHPQPTPTPPTGLASH